MCGLGCCSGEGQLRTLKQVGGPCAVHPDLANSIYTCALSCGPMLIDPDGFGALCT